MESLLIRTTLAQLSMAELAAAYNAVYTDYVVPFNVDTAWAEQMVARYQVELEHSPLWLDDDGSVIGLAALAVRGSIGWIGGFGIAKHRRGEGLSHALSTAMIDHARRRSLNLLTLEVMAHNPAAIRTYARAGFSTQRDLSILVREDRSYTPVQAPDVVDRVADAALIAARGDLHTSPAAWQRGAETLQAAPDLRALVVGSPAKPRALAFYVHRRPGIGLLDLAAADAAAGATLLDALIHLAPHEPLVVINEPADSPLLTPLARRGWRETLCQHEMTLAMS